MIKHWCLIMVLFAATDMVYGQDSFQEKYESRTIYLQGRTFGNGSEFKPLREFKNDLLRYDDSAREFRSYQRDRKTTFWSFAGWMGMFVAGLITLEDTPALGTSLIVGGTGMYFFSLHKSIKSRNHLSRSVWYYNRDVLLDDQ